MSSLADLPEIVGFFSYSREDDQGSRGGLTALRDAIQTELSAQLGRSQTDFRIWQDKAAISPGTLWEKEITQGINQSAFFIPIVTPRALRSHHCALEFQSFLSREAELGRDDLVFPILYIPVPALEDEKLWRDDPVLRVVGTRQYLDWRDLRHHDPHSTEVRQKLERYCRGITNALHRPWVSPEERRRRENEEARQKNEDEQRRKAAQIEAERAAQEERRRREAEAARRAEEEERVRIVEQAARQRATEEQRRLQAAAEKEAQQERAFKAAKAAANAAAIDAFLAANPESRFAGEAQSLKSALRARADAFSRAMASDDPLVVKAFRNSYKKGPDVEQARARLRLLEPRRQSPKLAMIGAGAAAVILLSAGGVWFAMRPSADNRQVTPAAVSPVAPVLKNPPAGAAARPAPSAPSEVKAKVTDAISRTPAVSASEPASAPTPSAASISDPAAVAWSLLKDTSDAAALQRFTAQFPDSPLRKDAETRMTAIAGEQAAWNLVKDTKDPEQLRRFVRQFPTSAARADAEQRIASLSTAPPATAAAAAPDPHELARSLQFELMRVGCFVGKVTGNFDDDTKAAWHKFIKLTSKNMPDDASTDAISAVRSINKRVCPLVCPHGEHAESDVCVANEPPPPTKRSVNREAPTREAPAHEAPAVPQTAKAPCGMPDRGASYSGMSGQRSGCN